MDFSFTVRHLECNVPVAPEQYSLYILTVGDFPLGRKGCTFNGTTLSHSSIEGKQGTCCWTSVAQWLSASGISSFRIWSWANRVQIPRDLQNQIEYCRLALLYIATNRPGDRTPTRTDPRGRNVNTKGTRVPNIITHTTVLIVQNIQISIAYN